MSISKNDNVLTAIYMPAPKKTIENNKINIRSRPTSSSRIARRASGVLLQMVRPPFPATMTPPALLNITDDTDE